VGTEDSGVILIFIYYKCCITAFDKVLSIHLLDIHLLDTSCNHSVTLHCEDLNIFRYTGNHNGRRFRYISTDNV